jgi:hypothetical protein
MAGADRSMISRCGLSSRWSVEVFTPGRSQQVPASVMKVMEKPGRRSPKLSAIPPLEVGVGVDRMEHLPDG